MLYSRLAPSLGLAMLVCACGGASAASKAPILPLHTLRLYETGVGYYERSGALTSADATSLPVPAGHLDDALKSLVVLGPDGKSTVRGIEFGSSISRGMARALAGLPGEGDQPIRFRELLAGLQGAGVEVHTAHGSFRGRLVDLLDASADGNDGKKAEARGGDEKAGAKDAPTSLMLLLLTDQSEIVRLPAADVTSVRPLDPSYAARLGSALDALSTRGAQSERLLHVLASGGPVTLGYIAETPVWRTTYRLVLDASGTWGTLQGWALIHNDTDEDWNQVKVELANGRPDSFLFPLAAPRYARRQLVTPDDELATVPQLMGTTVDTIWGDHPGDSFGTVGLGLSGTGEGGGGSGEGTGLGSIGTIGHGAGVVGSRASSLLEVGNLAGVVPAAGVETAALFVYTLPQAVDLRGHGSALVPFLHQRIDARSIAWVDENGSPARSAVRFVNSTSQTLPPGTIAFFSDGGFAGESGLERLKPGERRFVKYGFDLDVALRVTESRATDEPRRLVFDRGGLLLEEHYLRTTDFKYSIENRSGRPRIVLLTMRLDPNAQLTGPDAIDFDSASAHPLAVFNVDARKKVDRTAHAVEGLATSTALVSLTSTQLLTLAGAPTLQASDRGAATEAAARLREAEADDKAIAQTKADLAEVGKDLERMREHMKALAGDRPAGGAVANPFAARVLAGEDKLTLLRKRLAGFEASARAKRDAMRAALEKLAR